MRDTVLTDFRPSAVNGSLHLDCTRARLADRPAEVVTDVRLVGQAIVTDKAPLSLDMPSVVVDVRWLTPERNTDPPAFEIVKARIVGGAIQDLVGV